MVLSITTVALSLEIVSNVNLMSSFSSLSMSNVSVSPAVSSIDFPDHDSFMLILVPLICSSSMLLSFLSNVNITRSCSPSFSVLDFPSDQPFVSPKSKVFLDRLPLSPLSSSSSSSSSSHDLCSEGLLKPVPQAFVSVHVLACFSFLQSLQPVHDHDSWHEVGSVTAECTKPSTIYCEPASVQV